MMHDFIRYAYRYIGIGLGSHIVSSDLRVRRGNSRRSRSSRSSGVAVVEVVDVVEVVVLGASGLRNLAFRISGSTGTRSSEFTVSGSRGSGRPRPSGTRLHGHA